jgi:CPA2 family monovalent cation:H+ antiporter-2
VARAIVEQAQRLNAGIEVVARVADPECIGVFRQLGVREVVVPEYEASLEMTRQALIHLRLPAAEIQRYEDAVRQELYEPLASASREYALLAQLRGAERQLTLDWFTIATDSPLSGRSLGEAAVRQATGASVVAVLRGEELTPNPPAEFRLEPGDLVAVLGDEDTRAGFQAHFVPAASGAD